MKKRFTLQSVALLWSLVLIPFLSFGQDLPVVERPVTVDIQGQFGYNTYQFMQDPRAQKIGSDLLAVKEMHDKGMDLSDDAKIHVEGDKVLIQAFAKSVAQAQDLLNSLNSMGMTNGVAFKHVINGMLPFNKIDATVDLPALRSISLSITPKAQIGSVTSQGDISMGADQVRAIAGVDGSGLKIGILSDSYDAFGGAAAAGIASGDLPGPGNPNGFTAPVEVLQDAFGTDEGRGMAELVHDVAPGAQMAFHTANGGFANFANGIIALRQAGCDIIVDDIAYLAQPYFQDDIIGQAANAVVADGAMYFSAAGNSRDNSYDEGFNPGGFVFDFGFAQYEPHDWGGGDYFLQVTLPPGAGLNLWLQWDEPSLFAGLLGPEQDLDILIFNEDLTTIIDGSFLCNSAIGSPVEFIQGGNGGATPLVINILVGRFGPVPGNPNRIKFLDFQGSNVGQYFENAEQINKPTIVGHPNTNGAIAVGAAAYFNTPAFGVSPAILNSFSSIGGTPILFDEIGNRLAAPENRLKPEITGPDGGNTTFFGGGDSEPDGFPNFFGTSAAAPNVAALAALIKQVLPNASNAKIRSILLSTAMDLDDPRGVFDNVGDSNFDFATGNGFVDGVAAVQLALIVKKNIPTMSEWGLALFLLLITSLGLATVYSVKFAPALSGGGQVITRPGFKLFFDRAIFYRKLPYGLLTLAVGAVLILVFWGEILTRDIVGLAMALPLVTYILHLMEVLKENDGE